MLEGPGAVALPLEDARETDVQVGVEGIEAQRLPHSAAASASRPACASSPARFWRASTKEGLMRSASRYSAIAGSRSPRAARVFPMLLRIIQLSRVTSSARP